MTIGVLCNMAKNNPKAQSIRYPSCIDNLIHRLVSKGLVSNPVVRDCRHTRRGNPRKPLVQFREIHPTNQTLLEAHCGSEGCYKVYVVPINPKELQAYISENYS